MKVSVLGMGRMGQAAGARLIGGDHQLVVWNRSSGRATELVSAGAAEAGDIRDATTGAEVVISILANDDAVREVALGAGGVLACIGEALYVDSSTVSPELSGELSDRFERFCAMPILGSPDAVRSGDATYLVGGPAALADRLQPVLQSLTSSVKRYDTARLAGCAKLANNLLLLSGVVALAEAFAVGRAGGLSDEDLRDLLAHSPMVAPGLANRFEAVLSGGGPAWWTAALGAKDAGLAVELGAGCALRVAPVVRDAYREAADLSASRGSDQDDIAAVASLYR